ncbi:SH3 domain-containing protein [Xanthomonas sp. AmX2]|uniref:C40 family peptidase n=1 Tax=Xanthomonas sp. TaxID=29446 RepID=UPI00197E4529|nr:SH3 domain-containing protein [Xanthomonas sp.]MBN6151316.1 SH3 domain-containing protein [Xanthomonas sp.]
MTIPRRRTTRAFWLSATLGVALAATATLAARELPRVPVDARTGIVALQPQQLEPAYWIARQPDPDRSILDRAGIDAQNARMRASDPAIEDIAGLPSPLPAALVQERIQALSSRPTRTLYDARGAALDAARIDGFVAGLALDAIPATRELRYGLVVKRAALRTFPTRERVFSTPGDTDIDRFQESALFPGDAVAVLHVSRDGQWLFVASERYSAWIDRTAVAIGDAAQVLGYARRAPYRIVTGATAFTAYTPERPELSRLQLDMGVRVPVLADWPAQRPVNGQHPATSHVIELPVRNADGSLALAPALLPRSEDTAADYLPLTPRNLIAQAFKFLGERYGWGHDYGTRDCSGFVSEIYRSFGVLMPRNTSAQAISPALDRIAFDKRDGPRERMDAVRRLQVGDLVYIPGHVMLALGHADGLAYMIHDTAGGGWLGADGRRASAHLNGVSVTPLEPMLASDTVTYVDRITNIQRLRAKSPE